MEAPAATRPADAGAGRGFGARGGRGGRDAVNASSAEYTHDPDTAAEAFAALDKERRGVLGPEDVVTLGQIMGKSMTKTELATVFRP